MYYEYKSPYYLNFDKKESFNPAIHKEINVNLMLNLKNVNIKTIVFYILDIFLMSIIYFIMIVLLLTPITYIFNNKEFKQKSKVIIFFEIILELTLIIFVILIATFIINKIDIFKIKDQNNYVALKNLLIYINTAIAVLSMHVLLQEKIEYIFSDNITSGLFG